MDDVDWSYRGQYVWERHLVSVLWMTEALNDPDALEIDPDPSSKSGRSVRTIGFSVTAGFLVTVMTLRDGGSVYGVNGWKSNEIDTYRYRQESSHEGQ